MRAPDDDASFSLERLTERAAKLIPRLRARALETTKQRRIPDETIRDLWDADLFYLLKPKKFGGPAVRPDIAFQVADQLGRGDGSAAWVWSVMTIHDLFGALSGAVPARVLGQAEHAVGVELRPGRHGKPGQGRLPPVRQMVVLQRHRQCRLDVPWRDLRAA
jgi:alkylation response protein AidB-like acyl-CoA dehydrogenase